MDDVNNAVHAVIWQLSQQHQYTGIGSIQNELFRQYPSAFAYLRSVGRNPDSIPALNEHKRLIQRVNTLLWAYASTHNVVTLADMEELLKADLPGSYHLLGPVTVIPAAKEICHTSSFTSSVLDCFANPNASQLVRVTTEDVLKALNECVCHNRFRRSNSFGRRTEELWWQSIFTHHMLLLLGDLTIPNRLDKNSEHNYDLSYLGPYGIRINGFAPLFKAIQDNLRPENIGKANRVALECLITEVKRFYESFAEELLTSPSLRSDNPSKALKHLSFCTNKLHEALQKWATNKGFTWPSGYLDSLTLFGDFVKRISNNGPFGNLLRMILSISNRSSINWQTIIQELLEGAGVSVAVGANFIDLTNSPEPPVETKMEHELTHNIENIIQRFIAFMNETHGDHDLSFWQRLARFEIEMLPSAKLKDSSLLQCLSNAFETDSTCLPPCLCLPNTESIAKVGSSATGEFGSIATFDLEQVWHFLRSVTCIESRSMQELCTLVETRFKISHTEQLEQAVQSAVSEMKVDRSSENVLPVMYHYGLNKFSYQNVNPVESSHISWSAGTSTLFTQRDSVLKLLSSCPCLVDLEHWTQWSLPGMLADRWGDLESFLLSCGSQKVCDQSNLVALRVADNNGGPLLRFHSKSKAHDLFDRFNSWSESPSPQHVRDLLAVLVGATVGIGQSSVTETRSILVDIFSRPTNSRSWPHLLRDFLLYSHPSFIGPLFNEILVPCLNEAGLRDINSWPVDTPDIVLDPTSGSRHSILELWFEAPFLLEDHKSIVVSAIGTLGLQLNWFAFAKFFEEHRLHSLETKLPLFPKELRPKAVEIPQSVAVSHSTQPVTNLTKPDISAPQPLSEIPDISLEDREQFINELRRREFGCGAELNSEAVGLFQRVEAKLSRSLAQLSEGLYGLPGHFLLELIQNADDNDYGAVDLPTLEFCLVLHANEQVEPRCALLVLNNEAVGFTETDMASLCDIGMSTKLGQRALKTGRKGIGFKSVFNITNTPEVHSNGFHVRFHRESSATRPDRSSSLLLLPEWCHASPTLQRWPLPITQPDWCKTMLVLPIRSKMHSLNLSFGSVLKLIRDTLSPCVMLFLRRLRCLEFTCVLPALTVDQLDHRKIVRFRRNVIQLPSALGPSKRAELISITCTETCPDTGNQVTSTHGWLCFREKFAVDDDHLLPISPGHTEISLAISLTDTEPLPVVPVFSFLPVREAGFTFCINADFDLTSSREDIDCSSTWNQWLVARVPIVFSHLVQSIHQISDHFLNNLDCDGLPKLSRTFLIVRSLVSLSSVHSQSLDRSSLFCALASQLRERLSTLRWLPTTTDSWVAADRLLIPLQTLSAKFANSDPPVMQSATYLVKLLMDRLELHEPHPDLLDVASDSDDWLTWKNQLNVLQKRRETLIWLGGQSISAEAVLESVANLEPAELRKPGVLGIVLHTLHNSTSPASSMSQVSTVPLSVNRVVAALRHMTIFPLTTGSLVRSDDLCEQDWGPSIKLPILLPPTKSELETKIDLSYDDYIRLVSHLGPLVDPASLFADAEEFGGVLVDLPQLLVSKPPHGLGLSIALPENVVSSWIVPVLSRYASRDIPPSMVTWAVRLAQLYVCSNLNSNPSICADLPSKIPIVTSTVNQQTESVLPALFTLPGCTREIPVILPPLSINLDVSPTPDTPDDLECKLFTFLVNESKESNSLLLVSKRYFEDFATTTENAHRWFELFSGSGVCTLLSVHPRRYLISNPKQKSHPNDLLPLAPNDPMTVRLSQALTQDGLPEAVLEETLAAHLWIIEDFVSPGIDLLLNRITRCSKESLALEAAYQLACLVHDNWPDFECVSRLWYINLPLEIELKIPTTTPLRLMTEHTVKQFGMAHWLQQLRENRWLPVESRSHDTLQSPVCLESPVSPTVLVYSPSVTWIELQSQRAKLVQLLQYACHVWYPGPYILRDPPSSDFVNALGIHSELNPETFDHLMNTLSSEFDSSPSLRRLLDPALMIELYQLAVRCANQRSDSNWLRPVFAKSHSPCILVQCPCPGQFTIVQQAKRGRTDADQPTDLDELFCPICSNSDTHACKEPGSKRLHATVSTTEHTYHLVQPDAVCWKQLHLPQIDLPADDDDDDGEVNTAHEQCALFGSVSDLPHPDIPHQNSTSSRFFELASFYDLNCRNFFTEILGISSTLSVVNCLRLRPTFVPRLGLTSFGRRLAEWYALIHLCLQEDGVLQEHRPHLDQTTYTFEMLWNFPLMFGADGKWYKPCEVILLNSTLEEPRQQTLFAWSKVEFARLFATGAPNQPILLAHSLELLNAQRTLNFPVGSNPNLTPVDVSRSSVHVRNEGTSHGFLLDVLGLPVLDRVCSLVLKDEPDRHRRMIPCKALELFLRAFRLIVEELWNSAVSKLPERAFDKCSCQGAYLVDNLTVALRMNTTSAALNKLRITSRCLASVIDNVLYVDSTLGAELLARLSALSTTITPLLLYFCVGLLDDPAFLNVTSKPSGSLFLSLADHVFPHAGLGRASFTNFIHGLINLIESLIPDLRATLGLSASFSPHSQGQLENYLTSHGVRKSVARRVLPILCCSSSPATTSEVTASTEATPIRAPSVVTSFPHTPINVEMLPAYSKPCSTRFDTVFSDFTSRRATNTASLFSSDADIWRVSLPDSLTDRLKRMLTQYDSTSTDVGRAGEMFVYHHLTETIQRVQDKHHHFDQVAGLDFPTGHPLLGTGRVVRCHWCNKDAESRQPFDIEVDLQVECTENNWHQLMDSVRDELAANIIRIKRRATPDVPGILLVGPLYLEVKSTLAHATHSSSSPDLFQLSVNEIACALHQGWRYHLLRVVWSRDVSSDHPPKVVHIPDMIARLREHSPSLQLCIAMLHS